jgi:hypothetical protein
MIEQLGGSLHDEFIVKKINYSHLTAFLSIKQFKIVVLLVLMLFSFSFPSYQCHISLFVSIESPLFTVLHQFA